MSGLRNLPGQAGKPFSAICAYDSPWAWRSWTTRRRSRIVHFGDDLVRIEVTDQGGDEEPCKGTIHTATDVADELCDVISPGREYRLREAALLDRLALQGGSDNDAAEAARRLVELDDANVTGDPRH